MAARKAAEAQDMHIDEVYALLTGLELREVEDLGADWFEAELADSLELA